MKNDPIIEQVRAVRRQLSEEAGDDLHEICNRLREWEKQHPDRMVATTIAPAVKKAVTRRSRVRARPARHSKT